MAKIVLKNIGKTYEDGVTVIDDLNLTVEDGEFVILVGPSGCGKSTTLRMISGLEEISRGELYIGDRLVNEVAPKDRDIAMVFQSYALYPHMSVYRNMSFALELRRMPKEEIERRVREAARILDIEEYLDRKPRALSGGQRQRVALGRAIVRDPKVFLLDEPLSNLDAKLRAQMRAQITELHRRLGTTFVYVTHDQVEAMTMADRIVVMKDGVIQQHDTPENLYHHPKNTFVASFIGTPEMNILSAEIKKARDGVSLCIGKLTFPVPKRYEGAISAYEKERVLVGIRPEAFRVGKGERTPEGLIALELEIELSEMMGSEFYLYTRLQNSRLVARVESRERIGEGEVVTLLLDSEGVHLFDSESHLNLLD